MNSEQRRKRKRELARKCVQTLKELRDKIDRAIAALEDGRYNDAERVASVLAHDARAVLTTIQRSLKE